MATNRLQVTDLDFDTIKTNLKNFLKSQTQFQDYDFEGAGLNVLLDILAYNTHYQAYYLNMVANESFLDSAIIRDSVISHAKTLGYIPYSRNSARAIIDLTVNMPDNTADTLTLERGFNFKSDLSDDVSYNFILLDDTTVSKANSKFYFQNLPIYQGTLVTYTYTYDEQTNPKSIFEIPDENVDTKTLQVLVTNSSANSATETYKLSTEVILDSANSSVYFLQETRNNKYEIYFGDGNVGKKLVDGSVITMSYLITDGAIANKVSGFVISSQIQKAYTSVTANTISSASGGSDKESIDSIKFSAPLQYATQNRLVTKTDYESYIKKNYPSIDSLSVWGGEDEVPPVYGKVLISLKPKDNYYLSEAEKRKIIDEIITPKSILSVSTEIRDPNYLYILLNNNVVYNPKRTTLSESALTTQIKNTITNYKDTYLNKFNAVFSLSKLQEQINNIDVGAIIGTQTGIKLQKRIVPELNTNANYTVNFGVPLKRGGILNRLTSPEFISNDSAGEQRTTIIEEVPQSFTGISSIEIVNPGYGYTTAPTVTITGDGVGATAEAVIQSGRITQIKITNRGFDYTRAVVTISGGGGNSGLATAVIDSKVGALRTIYYDENANRRIINPNLGEIDYTTGRITLNDLKVLSVIAPDGLLRLTVESESDIIESNRDTIITIDGDDPASIVTTVERTAS
jgi:hypothetical protein